MTISAIIIFLSILFALVVVHELGHFLFAKAFKMRVDEFAFGFPPKLLSKKYKDTLYSFNLIPLGGYVKIYGENGMSEEEIKKLGPDAQKLFGNFHPFKRILVLIGGVVFNILAAIMFFTFSLMHGSNLYLSPTEVQNTDYTNRELVLVSINDKSPLVGTGITEGDKIVSLESGGEIITENALSAQSATQFIQKHNDSIIKFGYQIDGEAVDSQTIKTIDVVPKAGIVDGRKVVGAQFADFGFKKYSFFPALNAAIQITYEQLIFIFVSLGELLKNLVTQEAKVEDSLSGPVGLAILTSQVSTQGIDKIFFFTALLSLSLAAFNILPIPALDGGRIVFVLYEIIFRRKIKAHVEQLFHGVGFIALLLLMLFVTYYDIVKALN